MAGNIIHNTTENPSLDSSPFNLEVSLNGAYPVYETIKQQRDNPPSGDPYIGSFYAAFIEHLEAGHTGAIELLQGVNSIRKLTPALHTNLLFRAFQATLINSSGYPEVYDTPEAWSGIMDSYFDDPSAFNLLFETLANKTTTTTVFQRYAGERAVMAYISRGKSVKVADLACGGNYGLPGISLGLEFSNIKDDTPTQFITDYINRPLNISEALAIDMNNPYEPSEVAWRHSCGIYPSELLRGGLDELLELEQILSTDSLTKFHEANILDADSIHRLLGGNCDFILLNTMLYQLSEENQLRAIQIAKKALSPTGWLLVQDFAQKRTDDSSKLDFQVNWGVKGNYRLFGLRPDDNAIYELIRWNNSRCKQAEAGIDLMTVLEEHRSS